MTENVRRGKYIIFEGSEGVGKSKLALKMAQHLDAEYTFEPYRGDPLPLCSKIFQICCSKNTYADMTTTAREMLLLAGREISQGRFVTPVLDSGRSVVSDRSYISGLVYAQMEGMSLHKWCHIAYASKVLIKPDLVVFVKNKENKPKLTPNDRYDHEDEAFFRRIEHSFSSSLEYLKSLLDWPDELIHTFDNNFDYTQEENFNRLLKELEGHKCLEKI